MGLAPSRHRISAVAKGSGGSAEGRSSDEECSSGSGSGSDVGSRSNVPPEPWEGGGESRPQISRGRQIYPEHWGMTRQQIRDLLMRLRSEPAWTQSNTVYALVRDFIVPWTAGTGLGYALLVNEAEPKEVNVMISHCFSENAEEFLEATLRATDDRDVVYICALANYQAEDGCGPTITEQLGRHPTQSPFWRVLAHIASEGAKAGLPWRWRSVLLRLPTFIFLSFVMLACSPQWSASVDFVEWFEWGAPLHSAHSRYYAFVVMCFSVGSIAALAVRLTTRRLYPGRMVVVPNNNEDVYSRLWCVYEIFVARTLGVAVTVAPTLATAGRGSSRDARCSNLEDDQRIRREIERRPGGYRAIDYAVRRTVAGVQRHLVGLWLKYLILQVVPIITALSLMTGFPILTGFTVVAVAYGAWIAVAFLGAKRVKGVIPTGAASAAALCAFVVLISILRESLFVLRLTQVGLVHSHTYLLMGISFFLYETAAVGVLPLAAVAYPFQGPIPARCRLRMLFSFFCLLLACSCFQSLLRPPYKLNNAIVLFNVLDASARLAPTYMTWTEMLHFGFTIDRSSPAPPAAKALSMLGCVLWLLTTLEVPFFVLALCGKDFVATDALRW